MSARDKKLAKALRQAGWRRREKRSGSGHVLWLCPCGEHILTQAWSPSDRRSDKNDMAIIRRCARGAI